MQNSPGMTGTAPKTPKVAAVAGIIFSLLLLVIFGLLREAVPADPLEPGLWLQTKRSTVALALNLTPFAGIAFLWFIGTLRSRLGEREDRFFATVFLGSSLLFVAMLFFAAAIIGALLLITGSTGSEELAATPTFAIARATIYILVNVYALKLAAVFLISTSTIVIYTQIAPRWIAVLGYILAGVLLAGSYFTSLSFVLLPIWVLLMSSHIVLDTFRNGS